MNETDIWSSGAAMHRSEVELRVPADSAYVSVLRTTAAGLAARLDFTIDDIEDLRMAVSEACALVLPAARTGSDLVAEFVLAHGEITVIVSVPGELEAESDEESWGWQVLTALTTSCELTRLDGKVTVTMTLNSAAEL